MYLKIIRDSSIFLYDAMYFEHTCTCICDYDYYVMLSTREYTLYGISKRN